MEFYSKNKLREISALVGFIIRIYHNARSPEHQFLMILLLSPVRRESGLKIDLRNSSSITEALKLFHLF